MPNGQRPITRMWSGHVPAEQAEGFHQHLLANAVEEARGVAGFLGATVLHQQDGDRVRFTLLTTWADDKAVRRFAGDATGTARHYAGDERFELVPDLHVTHYEVAYQLTEQTFPAVHDG